MLRVNETTKAQERKIAKIEDFRGLDQYHDPFSIDAKHAFKMKNFINKNGLNHKRNGYSIYGVFNGKINGWDKFTIGNEEIELVYAGKTFYYRVDAGSWTVFSVSNEIRDKLKSQRATFFYDGERIFVVGCGDYLFVEKVENGYELKRVFDDEKTYIPTTFIADYVGSVRGLQSNAYEPMNMLSSWKINKFYDSDIENESGLRYRVDNYVREIDYEHPSIKIENDFPQIEITRETFDKIEKFHITKKGEAYRLVIPENLNFEGSHNYYRVTFEINDTTQYYYLKAYESDTSDTEIYAVVLPDDSVFFSRSHETSVIWQDKNDIDVRIVPCGYRNTKIEAGEDISGKILSFYGGAQLGNLSSHKNVFKYQDNGVEKKIQWKTRSGNGDWDSCVLTDENETFIYGYAYRSSWLTKYTAYFGENLKKIYGDTFDNKSIASYFIFPTGASYVSSNNRANKSLLNADGSPYENYYGYILQKEDVDEEKQTSVTTDVGVVSPYNGEIIFYREIFESWSGVGSEKTPNITVKYKFENDEYLKITGCTIGTLFGLNGNADRLFLSGNADYPNLDWHSSHKTDGSVRIGDFTYFQDTSVAVLGSEETKIVGYQRISDDSVAIFKSPSDKEPTLYVRTGVREMNSGNNYVEYYPNNAGYVTEGAVNASGFGVLGSDVLMLSPNGVFGLEIESDFFSQRRFLRERSKKINSLLKREDLSKAVSFVYDNKFFLAVGRQIFIADARFKTKEEDDMPDTFSYEWWQWTNFPIITFFFEKDGKLFFGSEEGVVYEFEDGHEDELYVSETQFAPVNFIQLGFEKTRYAFEPNYTVVENTKVIHKHPATCSFDLTFFVIGKTQQGEEIISLDGEADQLDEFFNVVQINDYFVPTYKSRETENFLLKDNDHTVVYIDSDKKEIIVQSGEGETVADGIDYYSGEYLRVSEDQEIEPFADPHGVTLSFSTFYLCNVEEEKNMNDETFFTANLKRKENADSPALRTVKIYSNWTQLFRPIDCEWISGNLNFNSNYFVKQIERIILTTEGAVSLAIETKNALKKVEVSDSESFDLESMNFNEIRLSGFSDFNDVDISVRKVKIPFTTLCMRIRNNSAKDFVVHSVEFIYKKVREIKGVR